MAARQAATPIALSRDCPAILVPSGERVMFLQGDVVTVVQRRGGAITVRARSGSLARVANEHADALGLEMEDVPAAEGAPGEVSVEDVLGRLRSVYDPEIPVNVVDLGLIYRVDPSPHPGGGYRVEIDMSMTAPGCGMGDVLREEATMLVETLPNVAEVAVSLVWDPPWTIERMSEAARLELGLL